MREVPDFLRGVVAPLFTPCFADRRIDFEGCAGLTRYLAATGKVRSVFARSGLGKMWTFSMDETKAIAQAVVPAAKESGIGALVGCAGIWAGRNSGAAKPDPERYVAQSVELIDFAASVGADAAVLVMPEAVLRDGDPAPAETIFRYFQTVHEATALSLVLYNPPGTPPEAALTPSLLTRLLTLPRIVGAKVSSDKDAVMVPLAEVARPSGFGLICGDEDYYRRGLEIGGVGVIGEGACGYPEILDAVRIFAERGDTENAEAAQQAVIEAQARKEGADASLIWMQLMIRRGAKCQTYYRGDLPPYPAERVATLDAVVEALYRPLRAHLKN